MRVVLDYGGVIVHHGDEREYADLLGISPDEDPYPGWLAYYLYRAGFLNEDSEYISLLSTLTGADEEDCAAYLQHTWLDPEFPARHAEVIEELASEHSLFLFGNMVRPWIVTVLRRQDVLDCFDALHVSSELERPKPHPRGYVRCLEGADDTVVMVSDEFNEDLLMAQCLGMTTVWVETEAEDPYRQPDYTVDGFEGVPGVLEEIRSEE